MLVYGFKKDKIGLMEIGDDLKAKQDFVGGLIERTALNEHLDLICNEEGWLIGLEPRVAIKGIETIIAGDCFVCRYNSHGDYESIKECDVEFIENKIKYITEEELLHAILMSYFNM